MNHPLAWLALFGLAYFVFLPAYAARQGIAWRLKRCAAGLAVYLVAYGVLTRKGNPPFQSLLIAGASGYIIVLLFPKRSRHIPAEVKRRVAKRDLRGGARMKDYHFDHRWPFALGGSHSEDNLRLIPKTDNQRKGKKKPRLRDWL